MCAIFQAVDDNASIKGVKHHFVDVHNIMSFDKRIFPKIFGLVLVPH